MNRTLLSLTIGLAAAFLANAPAQAADSNSNSSSSGLITASTIKGTDVINLQNQSIGDVDEVLVDPSSGRIRFLVLGVGGFLGVGETEVAVPWDAFKVTRNGNETKFVLDASKERLEKAPRVEGKKYDRLYSRGDSEPTFTYWGITWYDLGPLTSPSPGASASPGHSGTSGTSPAPSGLPTAHVSPPMAPKSSIAPSPHQ
ncbi:MAG: PRC-barrel domain-containing protein [Verrucomicrobiota bacterium]|nr:PRC-barrel domain-containing protein [Verrucomicrobiota bacterium]